MPPGTASKKIFLTMKLIAILLFAACMQVCAEGYSQNVTLLEKNAPLKKVFTEIHKQTGYTFFCNETLFENTRSLTIKVEDAPLETALAICLKDHGLAYTIVGKNIVIKEKEPEKYPFPIAVSAPELFIDIRGRVLNDKGEPLVNASIVVKGTKTGTTSDANGYFSINTTIGNTLVISYIDYEPVEVKIKDQQMINVSLKPSSEILNADVVVIGYGTVKRKDLTGSVSSVKAADIVKSTDASLNTALQGRAAGVSVVSTEGMPGADVSILVRAGSSISASNDPLYVIDGFPSLGGSNLNLNPNDIESVEILKDASATAIYGSRGANGVIIITTKSGKTGRFNVEYSGYYAIQQLGRKIDVMNSLQYAEKQHYISANPRNSSIGDSLWYNWPTYKDSISTNWQDKVYQLAGMHSHNISFTGGNAAVKMAGSINVLDQDGIAIGTNYKRYTARLNAISNISSRITNNTIISLSHQDRTGASLTGEGGLSYSAVRGSPFRPPGMDLNQYLEAMGTPIGGNTGRDPTVDLLEGNVKNLNYFASLNTSFTIKLIEGLSLKIAGGVNFSNSLYNYFYGRNTSQGQLNRGVATKNSSWNTGLINENTLNYTKEFGKSKIDAVAGYSIQNNVSNYTNVATRKFPIEALGYNSMAMGEEFSAPSSGQSAYGMESYFGRVQYAFLDRYILTGTMRADGSSKFPIHKWGYFPSGGFAWKVTDENFMQGLRAFSTLKLRVTYGLTGNESIAPYSTYTTYSSAPRATVQGNAIVVGVLPAQLGSPELKWETNIQSNLGIDLGFFKDRILFTADVYRKRSKDLLLRAPLPVYSGFNAVTRNIGDMEVKGAEFALNTVNLNGKLRWMTNFNITFNTSKVLSLNEGQEFFYTGSMSRFSDIFVVRVGERLGSIFGYVYDGLINTQEELAATPVHNSVAITVGTRKYKDINNSSRDGKLDGVVDANDRTVIGNGNPKFFGGFANDLSYGPVELSFLFTYSYGNDIINAYKSLYPAATQYQGGPLSMFDRWTPENPQINNQRWNAAYNGEYNFVTSYMVEDGSYLRLKNILLAYNMNQDWLRKAGIKNIRAYVSGQNLLTFTRYTGYDPEVSYFNSIITPGADLGAYPRSRIYTFGLNVTF